ncbi:hypothetical protein V9T40_006176 [Parthenolecanium corni]|uniref:Uncharacterized protein n=1 Tax=Parthenolecanium corni TaxID=536013 RepID=A0AAN9TXS7_9HEMI
MLKFVLIIGLAAASRAQQDSTTGSGFQNFFNKIKDAGANIDFAQLSAGAAKAQETLGPMLTQLKGASKPIQDKLAEVGLVPTTTANPVGGVMKHLQMVGIGSDVDVAKLQENAKKAQDTFGPLFNQFSSFVNKKSSSGAVQQSPPAAAAQSSPVAAPAPSLIDKYIIEDQSVTAAAPVVPPAAPAGPATSPPSKSTDIQNAFKKLQDVGSKIDINQVKDGAQKIQSFFSQFSSKTT